MSDAAANLVPSEEPNLSSESNVKVNIGSVIGPGDYINADGYWPKATKKDDGLPEEIRKLGESELIRKGAELLVQMTSRTGIFRQMAEIVLSIRIKHKTSNGMRDLQGRSSESRKAIEQMYRQAGIPKANVDNTIQAAIRYHVRKLAWLEATPKEREVLKLKDPFNLDPDNVRAPKEKPAPTTTTTDAEGEEETQHQTVIGPDMEATDQRKGDPLFWVDNAAASVKFASNMPLPDDKKTDMLRRLELLGTMIAEFAGRIALSQQSDQTEAPTVEVDERTEATG